MTDKKLDKEYELILQVAILKNNEQVRQILKEELNPLHKKLELAEEHRVAMDMRLQKVEEIVEPLQTLKNKFWLAIITVALASSVVGSKISDLINNLIK